MKAVPATARINGGAEAETALAHLIRQISEVREQMKADDAEINQIRAEVAALKTEGDVLKMEGAVLKTETRALIAGLRSVA